MFFRKLLVVLVPILVCLLLCWLLTLNIQVPDADNFRYIFNILCGALVGVGLCLSGTLASTTRKRDTFFRLHWIVAIVLFIFLVYQYAYTRPGSTVGFLPFLHSFANRGDATFTQAAFMGFLATSAIRGKR